MDTRTREPQQGHPSVVVVTLLLTPDISLVTLDILAPAEEDVIELDDDEDDDDLL